MLISVVLPAPLGPSSAKISPRRISRLMSLRATSPEAYVLNSFEIEMMGCMGMRTFMRKSVGGDWMRGGSGLLDGRAASRPQILMTVNRVRAGSRKCSAFDAVPDGSVYARAAYMCLSGKLGNRAEDAVAAPSRSPQGPIDMQHESWEIIVSSEMVDRRNGWPHT